MDQLALAFQQCQDPNPDVRNQAETQLETAAKQQYDHFLVSLLTLLADEVRDDVLRQAAGIYAKNLIVGHDAEISRKKKEQWLQCNQTAKDQARGLILQALASTKKVASHTAAQVLGGFGAVDVPRNEWPNLMNTLFGHVNSPEVGDVTKVASLEAVGYICENVDPTEVQKETVDLILTTIVAGMNEDRPNDIRGAAVVALNNSLEFASSNFQVDSERDYIMNAVCSCCRTDDARTRQKAFECLPEIANLYYDKLTTYIEALFNLTTNAIKEDIPEIGMMAMEFWVTVAETEYDMGDSHLGVCKQALPFLVPITLMTLTKQEDGDGGDDSWGIAGEGAVLMKALAQTCGDDIMNLVIPFVEKNITSADWRHKEAALVAFGSILDGPQGNVLKELIIKAFGLLLDNLKDPINLVKETAAWTIGVICELHIDAITGNELLLFEALSFAAKDSSWSVAKQACNSMKFLAYSYDGKDDSEKQVILQTLEIILQTLLAVAARPEGDLKVNAYEAANAMIEVAPRECNPLIAQVLQEALTRLQTSMQAAYMDQGEKERDQSLITGLIHICVRRLSKNELMPQANAIMGAVLQVLQSPGSAAHEESFNIMGFMAAALEKDFKPYVEYSNQSILRGLQNIHDVAVCRTAVSAVGDIVESQGVDFEAFAEQIMQCFVDS